MEHYYYLQDINCYIATPENKYFQTPMGLKIDYSFWLLPFYFFV